MSPSSISPPGGAPGSGHSGGNAHDNRAAAPVTFAGVAGVPMNLMGGVSSLLLGTAAIVAHGAARWVMLAVAVTMIVGIVVRRGHPTPPKAAPLVLIPSIVFPVVLAWQVPDAPLLIATQLTTATVYMALITPRPYGEIGVGAMAVTYLGSQFIFLGGIAQPAQAVGVVLGQLALGVLLLGVRFTTERKVAEHVQTISAVNARLERLNRTDPLTGLANRRELDAKLADAWTKDVPTDMPVSLLMIDIDHFKQYNDHYGHQGGDSCLQKVAAAVSAGTRDTDIAARYGGEEFSIILPGADLDAARRTAERVRLDVAHLHEEHATSPNGFVSVSVGVATAIPSEGGSITQLIQQADLGLYEAKRNGRNRVGTAPARRLPASRRTDC